MDVVNPWYNPRNPGSKQTFEVGAAIAREGGYDFYGLGQSVLAVKDGRAVTECVTVAGAIRELRRRGLLPPEPYVVEAGVTATIGNRRRYGGRDGVTYTWVTFVDTKGVEHPRDPWPCLMPPKEEVSAVCRKIAELQES